MNAKSSHPTSSVEFELRHRALIANLWVILATIVISAVLTLLFGDTGKEEALIGFSIYFVTNILALLTAYSKRNKLALVGYTTQVFIVSTVAMILMNDAPAHLVLAMVNFVLLHSVVLGRASALLVTAIMVALLFLANILGDILAPSIAALVESGDIVLSLSDNTTLISLMTTTISTGYLIVTTIGLKEQARAEALYSNTQLSLAQQSIQERSRKDLLLSTLGEKVVSATSITELHQALRSTLTAGLPTIQFHLDTLSNNPHTNVPTGLDTNIFIPTTTETLQEDEEKFVQSAIRIVKSGHNRIMTEQRIRETERLEGVGKLAASIAHDFNNLLVPISAYLDLQTITPKTSHIEQAAQSAVKQASALIERLLVYACSMERHLETVDLCSVIQSADPLLQNFVSGRAKLNILLPQTPVYVFSDKVELEQILLNTIVNALEAVEADGIIVVSLEIVSGEAQLEIRDSGAGIPTDLQEWVLEAFHTTKSDGSGLGLSTVYRIVCSYGGRLELNTAPEGGACVRITLPLHTPAPSSISPTVEHFSMEQPFEILLVDDDPKVGISLKEMLETLGHTVDLIMNAEQADSLLQARTHYDLVITDFQMPVINGTTLLTNLREFDHRMPVIILSGYGAAIDTTGCTPSAILSKPVRLDVLRKTIEEVMALHTQNIAMPEEQEKA